MSVYRGISMIERNLEVVHQHIMNEARDPASILDLYTDDIVQEFPTRGLIIRGKQDIAESYRRTFGSMADVSLEPLQRFATEDRVVDDMIARFRCTGDGLENAPISEGDRVELRLLHVFHMRGGLIEREVVHESYRVL